MESEDWYRQPKILLLDLEVTPLLGWAFGEWNTDIIHVERYSYLLCFSYKWLGEKEVKTVALPDFIRYKDDPFDDKDVVKALWQVVNEADLIIAHNLDRFDMRVAMGRFVVHKLTPPSPSKTVDTLKAARRFMRFSSNKLDSLGRQLNIGRKTKKTYGDLWRGCVYGNEQSWRTMIRYCEQDVRLVERIYLRLRPYITNHPNLATLSNREWACVYCGGTKLKREGYYHTKTYTYQQYVCKTCGGFNRFRTSERDMNKPDLVSSI